MMITRLSARVLPHAAFAAFVSVLALAAAAFAFPAAARADAPAASITTGPADNSFTNAEPVSFTISSPTDPIRQIDFACSIDSNVDWSPCNSDLYPDCTAVSCTQTKTYRALSEGWHSFFVHTVACDPNCDDYGATIEFGPTVGHTFTVDRTPPVLKFTVGPSLAAPLLRGRADFNFTSNELVTATCAIDTAAFTVCIMRDFVNADLANGLHTFTVHAVDLAGNASAPLVVPFLVDLFRPKKCKKGKSDKAKFRKCKKTNATAKAKWRKKHGF